MHRIKVVHITHSLGGVKTYIEHLLTYSNMNYFEHVIIAPEHTEFQKFCNELSITYYPVKAQRSVSLFKDISALFKTVSILKRENPDVIHAHSAKGGYLGRLAAKVVGAKVVYSPHAFSYLSFHGLKRILFYMLEFLACKMTDLLLAVSHSEASRAVHELGYKQNAVNVILNAIPVDDNLPFRNYNSCNTIGMISRLTHQKNPLLFLEVASMLSKRYPHLKFSILGAGMTDDLNAEIEDYLQDSQLKEKVNIIQWGDNNTSKIFLNEIDVFVLTSAFEGLPYSLLEAMSSGLPCVVSKVDGNTDVIHNNENGYSCLTAREFFTKIDSLIQSEETRRKFGQAGYRYVKNVHDIQKNIKHVEELYRQLSHFDEINLIPRHNVALSADEQNCRNVSPNI